MGHRLSSVSVTFPEFGEPTVRVVISPTMPSTMIERTVTISQNSIDSLKEAARQLTHEIDEAYR